MPSSLASFVKPFIPSILKKWRQQGVARRFQERMRGLNEQDVFSTIYSERKWGTKEEGEFHSGAGSRHETIVEPYVSAVRGWLDGLGYRPDAVDLGCGDFFVGRQIRPSCAGYIACDVVPELVAHNAAAFADLNVDFQLCNLAKDTLPKGEVVFVRQVLQHLSNDLVKSGLDKIAVTYRYLVLTEHLPFNPDFTPNADIETGAGTRIAVGSGIDITAPPFSLKPKAATEICRIRYLDDLILTTVYEFDQK